MGWAKDSGPRGRRFAISRYGLSGSLVLLYGTLGLVLLAYIVYGLARPSGAYSTPIDGWGVDAFELIAASLCLVCGLRHGRRDRVAILFGLALIVWALGDVVITIESLGGATPPTPSLADAFYLSFFPLSYVALALFVRGDARQMSSPNWLDGAVAGLGAAAVCAAFAFSTLSHLARASGLDLAVNLAYPVGDVLLLMLVVGSATFISGRRKLPWLLLAAGIGINVLGDTSNLLQSTLDGKGWVLINAVAWPTSTLLISLALWLPAGNHNPLGLRRPPGFLLPPLAAGAGLVVLFIGTLDQLNPVAIGLATASLLLVVLRTVLSVRVLRGLNRERQRESVTDHLTGLANRRRLFEALSAVFAQPPEERIAAAFLFVDLNHFKQVNDAFGHPVGDEVLRHVGTRMQSAVRPTDMIARVGGDEFAVLIAGADRTVAEATAERLNMTLDSPLRVGSITAHISSSIGIAMVSEAEHAAGLFACADTAMYHAKLTGEPFMVGGPAAEPGRTRMELVDDLTVAIESDHLVLHYQPQLDLLTRKVVSVEALVRWQHRRLGMIPPLTFLPLAEEAGLMGRVTCWVLKDAIRQCAEWISAGEDLRMSVNVSVGDLLDPEFPARVAELLDVHKLPARHLELEITETRVIEQFERVQAGVLALRDIGVSVSVDDFGAGFTSLAYLNRLNVSELKLDRQFIAPLSDATSSRNRELVKATVDLGHSLGLRVVAEGVEDQHVLELLADFGCDVAQGYGIARPAPAAELGLALRNPLASPKSGEVRATAGV